MSDILRTGSEALGARACATLFLFVASGVEAQGDVSRRDSAGVDVVENTRPVVSDGPVSSVAAEPFVTIGLRRCENELA